MKKTVEHRTGYQIGQNSFGQTVRTEIAYDLVTITGTLEELMEYSHEAAVSIARSPETEHLFPDWEEDSKYVVLRDGKVFGYDNRVQLDEVRGILA